MTLINNTDITTSENWTFLRIASNCKLGQIQTKSFFHVQREDKRFQTFVSRPMLFGRIPCNRCVSSNNFIKLGFDKQHSIGYIIANFMEFSCRKSMFTCSEKKRKFSRCFFEDRSDILTLVSYFTIKLDGKTCGWKSSWSNRLSSEFFLNIVKLSNFF